MGRAAAGAWLGNPGFPWMPRCVSSPPPRREGVEVSFEATLIEFVAHASPLVLAPLERLDRLAALVPSSARVNRI
jgi:hypothetical protein